MYNQIQGNIQSISTFPQSVYYYSILLNIYISTIQQLSSSLRFSISLFVSVIRQKWHGNMQTYTNFYYFYTISQKYDLQRLWWGPHKKTSQFHPVYIAICLHTHTHTNHFDKTCITLQHSKWLCHEFPSLYKHLNPLSNSMQRLKLT